MIICLVLLFQVAGDFYWKLYNNIGTTVICYKVAVRIKYNLEALEALQL
jgi:hypothetical protein